MILVLGLLGLATAYETDQLTDRELPLPDVGAAASAQVDVMLDEAIARANRRIGPDTSDERARRVLARRLHRVFTRGARVPGRGMFASVGYSAYSAWMETNLDRREFTDRRDIYGSAKMADSVILRLVGPSSTFLVDGVLIGSDKPDHFFDLGFDYFRWSRWGDDADRALRKGTFTERSYYGLLTSKTFSFADLAANRDGFAFYGTLLTEGSALERDAGGAVVRVRPWDWSEWVDPSWDEVLNPSVHTRRIEGAVRTHLDTHRQRYCGTFAAMEPVTVPPTPSYAADTAPTRTDPYDLVTLCAAP